MAPPSDSGLLPPDGVPWPPEPESASPAPVAPAELPEAPAPGAPAAIADWRTMPIDAPGGYHGSATAPPPQPPKWEPWCIVAAALAAAGLIGLAKPLPGWLLAPGGAIAFGLIGIRNTRLDTRWRGRWLAIAAIGVALGEALRIVIHVFWK